MRSCSAVAQGALSLVLRFAVSRLVHSKPATPLHIFTRHQIQVPMYLVQPLACRCLSRYFNRVTKRSFEFVRWKSLSASNLPLDMETVNTTERLKGLRNLMREHKLDVYSRNYGDDRA